MQLPYSEAELTCGTAFYTNLPEGVEVTNYYSMICGDAQQLAADVLVNRTSSSK